MIKKFQNPSKLRGKHKSIIYNLRILFTFIFFILTCSSCERDKTPLSLNFNRYTSHDYEWGIDTLHAPDALQVLMLGIWGTNENNVWVAGHSDLTKYQIWHWDGNRWQNQYLLFPGHPYSLTAIYGFSEDDIWMVGTDIQNYPNIIHRDFIINYDGGNWEYIENLNSPQCLSIWGSDPSNVFVGCDSGIVLYFNGTQWERQSTGTISRIYSISGFNSQEVYAAGYHLDKQQPIDTTFHYFFGFDGTEWVVKQSFVNTPFSPPEPFGYKVWASNEGKLYSVGDDGLYLWNSPWHRIREEQLFAIYGTSINNIFVGGWANQLLHFNGNDWKSYTELYNDSNSIYDVWCTSEKVFAISVIGNNSLIYRGQVKMERR